MMLHLLTEGTKSPVKGLLGALHPGIVHFPIALLAVGALLETIQILKKRKEPAAGTPVLAYLAAAAAVPASFFGFVLADYDGAEGSLIDLHKWMGVASTVVALIAAGSAIKAKTCAGSLISLRLAMIVGTMLVGFTGYLGGELVFGEGHLMKHVRTLLGMAPPPTKEPLLKPADPVAPVTPTSTKVDFAKEIAPIIKDMCFKCHGGEKVKGKFKMNTKALAMEGGESGKAILPGKPAISKFYTTLIDADEDILMPPPKEKTRPSKDQIEKVRKWIEEGAEWPDGYEFKK